MSRGQVGLLGLLLLVSVIVVGQMSAAVVPKVDQAATQTISDPFCRSTDGTLQLLAASVRKSGEDVKVSWDFKPSMPTSAIVKVDLASIDFKYHWLVMAALRNGEVGDIQTLDTVSKQRVGFKPAGAATAEIVGHKLEVTAPLPGAPSAFSWFAAAAEGADATEDLSQANFSAFCPAGWLASYPPAG